MGRSPDTSSLPLAVAISPDDGSRIDLRNPALAALLSWMVPGLGQCYQGRTTKGGLFMGSLLAALIVGLWLGGGRVVYASWRPGETRFAFFGQAGIGAVAIPALLQSARLHGRARQPWLASPWFAPPLRAGQLVTSTYANRLLRSEPGLGPTAFGDQPPLKQCRFDQLSTWHARLGRLFEIGTLYTVLAGMLNLLVVYDAWAGPLHDVKEPRLPEPGTQAAGRSRQTSMNPISRPGDRPSTHRPSTHHPTTRPAT